MWSFLWDTEKLSIRGDCQDCGLKATNAPSCRGSSQQLQDEPVWPEAPNSFPSVYWGQACLLQRRLWESSLSHSPVWKTYLMRGRVKEMTVPPCKQWREEAVLAQSEMNLREEFRKIEAEIYKPHFLSEHVGIILPGWPKHFTCLAEITNKLIETPGLFPGGMHSAQGLRVAPGL